MTTGTPLLVAASMASLILATDRLVAGRVLDGQDPIEVLLLGVDDNEGSTGDVPSVDGRM